MLSLKCTYLQCYNNYKSSGEISDVRIWVYSFHQSECFYSIIRCCKNTLFLCLCVIHYTAKQTKFIDIRFILYLL